MLREFGCSEFVFQILVFVYFKLNCFLWYSIITDRYYLSKTIYHYSQSIQQFLASSYRSVSTRDRRDEVAYYDLTANCRLIRHPFRSSIPPDIDEESRLGTWNLGACPAALYVIERQSFPKDNESITERRQNYQLSPVVVTVLLLMWIRLKNTTI